MHYWWVKFIYHVRRLLPLYANDSSKIYSAYAFMLLNKLSAPHRAAQSRYDVFCAFSEHFIEDISAERLAATLTAMEQPKEIIADFSRRQEKRFNPRADTLLRKTRLELARNYGISFTPKPPLNLSWSYKQESNFNLTRKSRQNAAFSFYRFLYYPYRAWRFFIRFKKQSSFKTALQKHFLKTLNTEHISDDIWLKNFERYVTLSHSPDDIEIMADVILKRSPARYLAFLDFTYRIIKKNPKRLTFVRRLKLAVSKVEGVTLPVYRGADLTQIFFNLFKLIRAENLVSPAQLLVQNSQDRPYFLYSRLNHRALQSNSNLAILHMSGRYNPELDMSALDKYSKLVILNFTSMTDEVLKDIFQNDLGEGVTIDCFSPVQSLIKPYTDAHKSISDITDNLAKKLIQQAFKSSTLKNLLEAELRDEYELSLSDNLYRSIEKFYATQVFFETISSSTAVFFNSVHENYAFSLARKGFSNVVIFGGYPYLGQKRDWTAQYPSIPAHQWTEPLRKAIVQIDTNIQQFVSGYDISSTEGIIIATHSRSSIHEASAQAIFNALTENHDVQLMDMAPKASAPQGRDNFYSISTQLDGQLKTIISAALTPVINKIVSDTALRQESMADLTSEISVLVARNAGFIFAQTSLYRAVKRHYTSWNHGLAILLPGRYAEIRTIAKAFQALGFPTLDVQLLFLSTMARYKAPMATHHSVIDTAALDFYEKAYGIAPQTVEIIGSISRDKDIEHARNFGRAASLSYFKLNEKNRVITLACQPGFENNTQEAAIILADYVKTNPDISLCVKLHPAQSNLQFKTLDAIFKQYIPEDMSHKWRVIHKDPFWKLIPATDILVSYFSNVCLQACAFNIPVLSLSGDGPRPDPDFETLGLARNVENLDKLPSYLDTLLNLPKAQRIKEPPYAYLQDNPHMADEQSLIRLKRYAENLLKVQRN